MANEKSTGNSNPGTFANDRQKASEAGHTGGSHQGKENNPANAAHDKQKAGEAGRKGDQPTKDSSRS